VQESGPGSLEDRRTSRACGLSIRGLAGLGYDARLRWRAVDWLMGAKDDRRLRQPGV